MKRRYYSKFKTQLDLPSTRDLTPQELSLWEGDQGSLSSNYTVYNNAVGDDIISPKKNYIFLLRKGSVIIEILWNDKKVFFSPDTVKIIQEKMGLLP